MLALNLQVNYNDLKTVTVYQYSSYTLAPSFQVKCYDFKLMIGYQFSSMNMAGDLY